MSLDGVAIARFKIDGEEHGDKVFKVVDGKRLSRLWFSVPLTVSGWFVSRTVEVEIEVEFDPSVVPASSGPTEERGSE